MRWMDQRKGSLIRPHLEDSRASYIMRNPDDFYMSIWIMIQLGGTEAFGSNFLRMLIRRVSFV